MTGKATTDTEQTFSRIAVSPVTKAAASGGGLPDEEEIIRISADSAAGRPAQEANATDGREALNPARRVEGAKDSEDASELLDGEQPAPIARKIVIVLCCIGVLLAAVYILQRVVSLPWG